MYHALGLKVIILSQSFEGIKNDYPNYESVNLNQLLEVADIISFHCKPSLMDLQLYLLRKLLK